MVQPGIEFGDEMIFHYNSQKAKNLSQLIERYDNMVFEAHFTDYQIGLDQFMSRQYQAVMQGEIAYSPLDLIYHKIGEVTSTYVWIKEDERHVIITI